MLLPGTGKPPAYFFLWILPKNLFSRLCGFIADLPLPSFILLPLIKIFSKAFACDLSEATQPIEEFKTFNQFFTRKLLPDARPLDPSPEAVLCPVDGTIGEFGTIRNGRLIQAKGLEYHLTDLLQDPDRVFKYDGGEFITIYLAPYNYHRIHSMTEGEVSEFSYIPGDLWTVSPLGVHHVPSLFARNERLTSYIQSKNGECALVKVGATVVGRIRVNYHEQVSNRFGAESQQLKLSNPYPVKRGAEIGLFELGSTVICLFPPGQIEWNDIKVEQSVRLGQALGRFRSASN